MRLKDILRAEKTNISLGVWGQGRIQYSAFPVAKAPHKAYRFGPSYRWRVVTFTALATQCRALVVFNHSKSIFRATLGVDGPNGMVLLADHEWHADEPGWHCHLCLEPVDEVPIGARRTHMRKWPRRGSAVAGGCVASEWEALQKALSLFRIEQTGLLL